jgi:hypothetical protein
MQTSSTHKRRLIGTNQLPQSIAKPIGDQFREKLAKAVHKAYRSIIPHLNSIRPFGDKSDKRFVQLAKSPTISNSQLQNSYHDILANNPPRLLVE